MNGWAHGDAHQRGVRAARNLRRSPTPAPARARARLRDDRPVGGASQPRLGDRRARRHRGTPCASTGSRSRRTPPGRARQRRAGLRATPARSAPQRSAPASPAKRASLRRAPRARSRPGDREPPGADAGRVLAKIEAGQETMRATVDTGWWATQGYDPARAIQEPGSHVVHVHLKDVLHEGEPHETCLGRGDRRHRGLPPDAAPDRLRRRLYGRARAGGSRPRRGDPGDARAARGVAPMKVALVGAGNIAGRYAEAILRTDGLELAGATDVDPSRQPSWSAILAASPTPRWPTCSGRDGRHDRQPDRAAGARRGVGAGAPRRVSTSTARSRSRDAQRGPCPRRSCVAGSGSAARRRRCSGRRSRRSGSSSGGGDRPRPRGLRGGELDRIERGPDPRSLYAVGPVVDGRLSAHDTDGDGRARPARSGLRRDARGGPDAPGRDGLHAGRAGLRGRGARARGRGRHPADHELLRRAFEAARARAPRRLGLVVAGHLVEADSRLQLQQRQGARADVPLVREPFHGIDWSRPPPTSRKRSRRVGRTARAASTAPTSSRSSRPSSARPSGAVSSMCAWTSSDRSRWTGHGERARAAQRLAPAQ